MKEFIISKKEEGLTLYKYSSKVLSKAPAGMLRKFLRKKNIELNRKRSDGSDRLKEGDRVCFFLSEETFDRFSLSSANENEDLRVPGLDKKRIIFEDEDYLFYDKPAGLLSQGSSKGEPSLNDSLLKYIKVTDTVHPSVCNRLDRNTSGLILCGKTYRGLKTLDEAIKQRRLEKYYLCVLEGRLKKAGMIRAYLKKDPQRNMAVISEVKKPGYDDICTGYEILKQTGDLTLVKVCLVTGKPHQIRAMSAFLGAPVAGDRKYGASKIHAKRQLLHSFRTVFPPDILDGRSFEAPIPEDMSGFFDKIVTG